MTAEKAKRDFIYIDELSKDDLYEKIREVLPTLSKSYAANAIILFLPQNDQEDMDLKNKILWFSFYSAILNNRCQICHVYRDVEKALLLTKDTITTFSPLGLTHHIPNTLLQPPDSTPYWIISGICLNCSHEESLLPMEKSVESEWFPKLKTFWKDFQKGYYPILINLFVIQSSWIPIFMEHKHYDKAFAKYTRKTCLKDLVSFIQNAHQKPKRTINVQEQLASDLYNRIQELFYEIKSNSMFCGLLKGVRDYLLMINEFQSLNHQKIPHRRDPESIRQFILKLRQYASQTRISTRKQVLAAAIQMLAKTYHDITGAGFPIPQWAKFPSSNSGG